MKVDQLKFRLVPVREETIPRGFKLAEFPPREQVESGNYLYAPVPMDDVELGFIPLSHLTLPGTHGDDTWLTMFPKKLHTPLDRRPGTGDVLVVGWGILVNEAFNWTQFLCLAVVVAALIGIVVVIY
ncbi:hypothetical protein CKAH01_09994 [Colletotrichum kahawae]|uniref:Uncharacterized protein n=1 Tax=Colletotrichum kahawae TaxID=34407 RepID=A0AAD9XX49_COLKA|nr:hypothetical protein CKAH01_09994 [Colletotrichum kahawae]